MTLINERVLKAVKGRKDVKRATWFRCDNNVIEHEDFFDFTPEELLVWIYIQSRASEQGTVSPFIHFERAERFARLSKKVILSAVKKLEQKHILPVAVPDAARTRNVRGTDAARTRAVTYDTNVRYDTNEFNAVSTDVENGATASVQKDSMQQVIELWGEVCHALPKVVRFTDARKNALRRQLEQWPDLSHWREVMQRWAVSEFCLTQWRPTFDDLLNEKKRVLTLEGKYDNRVKEEKRDTSQQAALVLQAIERIAPDHWSREAPEFLGPELFKLLQERKINVTALRAEPRNEFTTRRLAQRLSGEVQRREVL